MGNHISTMIWNHSRIRFQMLLDTPDQMHLKHRNIQILHMITFNINFHINNLLWSSRVTELYIPVQIGKIIGKTVDYKLYMVLIYFIRQW